MNWGDLRQEEFAEAIKKTDGLCIIPVGCYEMHGEHLPVRTDVYEAEAIARAAAEIEPVCVFPAYEFGAVSGLVEWKGSIRLEPTLMINLLENFCDEIARNGFDKILLLNYHGGNHGFLGHFMNTMTYKPHDYSVMTIFPSYYKGIGSFYEINENIRKYGSGYYPELLPEDEETIRIFVQEDKLDGHGGLEETCLMMAIRPELVRLDKMSVVSGLSTHKADRLCEAGLGGDTWIINYPNSYGGADPVGASDRIGRLLLRLRAEHVAASCKVYKEENYLLKQRRDMTKEHYNCNK